MCVLLHVGGMLFECVLSESCFLTAIFQFKGGFGAGLTVSMRLIQSHLRSRPPPSLISSLYFTASRHKVNQCESYVAFQRACQATLTETGGTVSYWQGSDF